MIIVRRRKPVPQKKSNGRSKCRYNRPVRTVEWSPDVDPVGQVRKLCCGTSEIGFLVVEFRGCTQGESLPWVELEPWTKSRAVTVADVSCDLASPALELAVCCDLVYLREGATLRLPGAEAQPSAGLAWALGRAGRKALDRGLLVGGTLDGSAAVEIGLARQVVDRGVPVPLPDRPAPAALTSARDLMRCRTTGSAGLALELATFRLLFASGEPKEGATAFLERRNPEFRNA